MWLHVLRSLMHLTTKWLPAQRKSLKNPRSKLTFLINGNPSFSRRQAFVYGSSTGFYSDSSSAAVAAAQTAAAAQHQGNLLWGVDKIFNPIQFDPIQSNLIQSDAIRSNPIQSDPVRSNPIQFYGFKSFL